MSGKSVYIFLIVMILVTMQVSHVSYSAETKTLPTASVSAFDTFNDPSPTLNTSRNGGDGWDGAWVVSNISPAIWKPSAISPEDKKSKPEDVSVEIQGTGKRNNPLRRKLKQQIRSNEIFISYTFHYENHSNNSLKKFDPEFFVLWLDRFDGSDTATHSNGIPNIGVHTPTRGPHKGKNLFMARIGSNQVSWSEVELEKGQTYQIVARLSKSSMEERGDYNKIQMWINPDSDDFDKPDASVLGKESVNVIRWIGFATGLKTEPTDKIRIDNLVVSKNWKDVFSSAPHLVKAHRKTKSSNRWTQVVDFKRDVFPLLKTRCFSCHSGITPESSYRLDTLDEILGESNGEPLVIPGNSEKSRLIELVASSLDDEKMPPPDDGKPLTQKEISLLRAWIDQGLKWDEKLLPRPEVKSDHWAFQSIAKVNVPNVLDNNRVLRPIDAFIRKAQQTQGVLHNPPATKRELARRVYLDLIGLPPTVAELNTFLEDDSGTAYEDLVDRLLASPHYGERWGRYWLDLARWAESMGYQHDIPRPYAWRYRDYVVKSFNEDKPYSQFLKEQVAGDEMEPVSDENLIATGFLAAARINGNLQDKVQQRNDVIVDIANVAGSAILGLTLECAQCHNHKFDPITQRDYYRFHGFFVNGQIQNIKLPESQSPGPVDVSLWIPKAGADFYNRERKKLKFKLPEEAHTWGYYSPLTGAKNVKLFPVVNRSPIPYNTGILRNSKPHLYIRGNVRTPGPEVGKGWPKVLGAIPESLGNKPRLALANWLTDKENPLVARVWVNRIWQFHFGQGLVKSSSDFGTMGEKPSHPELLDWLANQLIENDWKIKNLHRKILLSKTYPQSKNNNQKNQLIDPENKLLWRWPRRRLEAEAIRDSILVATGELDRTVGGPSIPEEREEKTLRRTIYLFQRRSEMPSVMSMFDAPAGRVSCSRRLVSTVALQPLYLLNSDFMSTRSKRLAKRIQQKVGNDIEKQVIMAFERTLCRLPNKKELERSVELLSSKTDEANNFSLMQYCHSLLNINEFLYIP